MDKGPWVLYYRGPDQMDLAGVISQDFTHDVALTVSGDFKGLAEKKAYCEWLVGQLNAVGKS